MANELLDCCANHDASKTGATDYSGRCTRHKAQPVNRCLITVALLIALVFLVGCQTRTLAPAAEYDPQDVQQIRDVLDSTLKEE